MKKSLTVCFIVIIFSVAILGISHNSMGQEVNYTYNVCLETKKTLDQDAEELRQSNDTIQRELLAAEHNLAVQNFNIRCNGEIR